MKRLHSLIRSGRGRSIAVLSLLGGASAMAQAASPPVMPPIVSPIDISSVATQVALFGGTMLLAWAGIYVGFKLAKKFIRRSGDTV